jgi:hypothetical protein
VSIYLEEQICHPCWVCRCHASCKIKTPPPINIFIYHLSLLANDSQFLGFSFVVLKKARLTQYIFHQMQEKKKIKVLVIVTLTE